MPSYAAIIGATSFCPGSTISLAAQPSNFIYYWSNGAATDSISVSASGTYIVSVGDGNCRITSSVFSDTLIPLPAAPTSLSGLDSVCLGSDSVLYAVSTAAGASSYAWTLPSGWAIQTGSGTNSIALSVNGSSGTLSVAAMNRCGSSNPLSKAIRVDSLPALSGAISGADTICTGDPNQIYIFQGQHTGSLHWTMPYSLSAGQGSDTIHLSGINSSGAVSLMSSNHCGQSSNVSLQIAVVDTPHPTLIRSSDTLWSTITGSSYIWYLNSQIISGANQQYYIPLLNGNYTVVVSDRNGCAGSSSAFGYTKTGIANEGSNDIHIYPNPATDMIYLSAQKELKEVALLNELGQIILTRNSSLDKLDLSYVPSGIYYLQVTGMDGHSSFFKISKR